MFHFLMIGLNRIKYSSIFATTFIVIFLSFPVAMYREPSLHDVGEAVPKLVGGPPSKSTTSEPVVMNGGKPVSKPDKEET